MGAELRGEARDAPSRRATPARRALLGSMLREPLTLAAAGLVLATYAAVLAVMPKGAFWSPDEGAKFIQMLSIGWKGGLEYAIPYAGEAIDPELVFYPTACRHEDLYPVRSEGGVRFHWPIWFSLASAPGFLVFGEAGLYLLPILGAWLAALAAGRLVRVHDPRLTPAAIVVSGLATPLFFYALTFWEHTAATALGLAALCILVEASPLGWRAASAMALLLFAAVVLRTEMAAFAIALPLAGLAHGRRTGTRLPFSAREWWTRRRAGAALAAASGALVVAALVADGFLTWRHRWLIGALPDYLARDVVKLPHLPAALGAIFVNSPGEQAPAIAPVWVTVALFAFAAAVASPFVKSERWQSGLGLLGLFVALQFSLVVALLPQPYLSLHGFLPVAPYVALGAYAVAYALASRSRPLSALAAACIVYLFAGVAVIFTFAVDPDGTHRTGLEWGARYLLTLYPLGAVMALIGVDVFLRSSRALAAKRMLAFLAAALLMVGVQFEVRGLSMLRSGRATVASWQSALEGKEPVLTDVWWLAAAMAPFFVRHPMFCVREPDVVPDWLAAAAARGVRDFRFAGFGAADAELAAIGSVHLAEERVVSGLRVKRFTLTPDAAP